MACEMGFWAMIDALSPDERERYLRRLREQEEAARFACDEPTPTPVPAAGPPEGERKP